MGGQEQKLSVLFASNDQQHCAAQVSYFANRQPCCKEYVAALDDTACFQAKAKATADGSSMILDLLVDENCTAPHNPVFDKSKQGDAIFPQPASANGQSEVVLGGRIKFACRPIFYVSGIGEVNGDTYGVRQSNRFSKNAAVAAF